jgi:hypothetical protein
MKGGAGGVNKWLLDFLRDTKPLKIISFFCFLSLYIYFFISYTATNFKNKHFLNGKMLQKLT